MTTPSESTARSDRPSLTPGAHQRAADILEAALDLPPDERAEYVARACGGDAALRAHVEAWLAATEQSAGFLEASPSLSAALSRRDTEEPESDLLPLVAARFDGRYTIERELGGGGMSRVFLAFDHALDRHLVIKVLRPELAHRVSTERFAREVRVAIRVQHPNIVPVLEAGELQDLPFYTMLFEGQSLRERLSMGTAPVGEALGILKDVARALAHAHGEGVVHRDIKPENVLLRGGAAVVCDFGIAKAIPAVRSRTSDVALSAKITSDGTSLGTPEYMSPEQVRGLPDVDERADVYSFGILAYELLAGAHPFAGESDAMSMMMAQLSETPRPIGDLRRELPPSLAALVMRCVEKHRDERFAHGAALLAALDAVDITAVRADTPGTTTVSRASVAVLPLTNLSDASEGEYFSDGITAEVIGALTRVHGLRVAAATSSFAFKGQSIDIRTVAERLGVATVLEGNISRAGSRVRIRVQLVSAADGLVLWSASYERELADIFAVQDEIASAIASAMQRSLASADVRPVTTPAARRVVRSSLNSDAFELYLRGRLLVEQRGDGMREGLGCFERAIQLDPEFAPSHAGMAYAFNLFGLYHALPAKDAFSRARDAAERALVIDPTDALALVMRAHTALWFEWDVRAAEALARRALELAPALYLAQDCLGFVLAAQGKADESITAMQSARALDPLKDYATYDLGWVMMLAGRWQQAVGELRQAVARHPESSEMRRVYGYSLFYSGREREALTEFRRVLELNPANQWGPPNLAQALAACGETVAARRLLAEIEKRVPEQPMPLVGLAVAHHWLGNDDAALEWLERAIDARDYWLIMLRYDPSMIRLRDNRRYAALMRRVTSEGGAGHVR